MLTDDALFGKGSIRPDGRKIHDMYLFEVKRPDESRHAWDYYKLRATIPAAEAFRPRSRRLPARRRLMWVQATNQRAPAPQRKRARTPGGQGTCHASIGSPPTAKNSVRDQSDAHGSVLEMLEPPCSASRTKPAFRCFGQTLTYADTDRLSRQFAAYLQAKLG